MTTYKIEELFQGMQKIKVEVTSLEEKVIATLEELAEEKDDEIKLEYGDKYWVVGNYGEPNVERWDDHFYDKEALGNNAIFETYEEAKFEAERLKVLRELEKLGRAFIPKKDNYTLCLQHDFILNKNMFRYIWNFDTRTVYGNYYFDTREELEQAVENIGEDRIKKYLFGVEE